MWGRGGGNVHTRTLRQSSATLSLRYPVGAAAWLKPLHGGRLQVMMMENNEVEKWREESSAFPLVQTGFGGPKEQPPHPSTRTKSDGNTSNVCKNPTTGEQQCKTTPAALQRASGG